VHQQTPPTPTQAAAAQALDPYDKNAPPPRRDWRNGLAPTYIGTFCWVVFYEQMAVRTLDVGGLAWTVAGVVAGAALARWLLYLAPALWGVRTGRPLAELSKATFGLAGSAWLPGLVVAVAAMGWFAAAIWYTTSTVLTGLELLGLVAPGSTALVSSGSLRVHGGSFLLISLLWSLMIGLIGAFMTRLVSAIANIYPIFPAAALAAGLLLTVRGLSAFSPTGIDPVSGVAARLPELSTLLHAAGLVFAFASLPGLIGGDWGAGSLGEKDVTLGGWVGLVLAPAITATLAMLIVAGSIGLKPAPAAAPAINLDPYGLSRTTAAEPSGLTVDDLTLTEAVHHRIGGRTGGLILLLLGVGSSGMAAFAAFLFSKRLTALNLGPSRLHWTILGALAAWPLVATGLASHLGPLFDILGSMLTPIAAAITADFLLTRGQWPGPRRGLNPAGWAAWIAGLATGLVLALVPAAWPASLIPPPMAAYAAGFVVYLVVGLAGGLSATGGPGAASQPGP
jgi:cytosine permease